MFKIYFFFLFTGDEDSNQPSKSNKSATQAPTHDQKNSKRTRAEVDDQIDESLPMFVQAALWQCFERMFGKRTLVESRGLRWGDVSLQDDPATGNERLVLKVGSSRGCQEEGEHPLQPWAVKLYKVFAEYRPSEAKEPNSPFYLVVKPKAKKEDHMWYINKPQAANKIGKYQVTKKNSAKRPRLEKN